MRATNIDDYIPIELYHEAKDFVKRIDEDVEIYKMVKNFDTAKPCPHTAPCETVPPPWLDALSAIHCMKYRFKSY